MRRRVHVRLVLLAALVGGLLSPGGPAGAQVAPAPTLRIVSPVAGETVSREVTVVAELVVGASHPALAVALGMTGRTVWVDVAADACIAPCLVRATIDSQGTSSSVPGWADGPGTLRASVGGVPVTDATVAVQVANERPVLAELAHVAGFPRPSTGWRHVIDVLPLAASTGVGTGGHEVVAVEWVSNQWRVPLERGEQHRWSLAWPVAHLATGATAAGYLVATDAAGGRSYSANIHLRRVTGPVLEGLQPDAEVLADRPGWITLSFRLPEYPQPATVTDVRLVVDGRGVEILSTEQVGATTAPASGQLRLGVGPVGEGPGLFQVTMTDSTGRTGTVEGTWPVRQRPRVTIEAVDLVDGGPGRVRASVSAPGGVVSSWTVRAGSRVVATSTACPCGSATTVDVPVTVAGLEPVEIAVEATVDRDDGPLRASAYRSVTPRPYVPATPFVAVSPGRSGADSLLTRRPDGSLSVYQIDGREMDDATWTRTSGWRSMRDLVSAGDLDADGLADVYARTPSGDLYRYEVQGQTPAAMSGVFSRGKVGHGWSAFRDLHGPGDWNGDGRADLLARDTAGRLWMYPGTGTGGLRSRVQVGTGWGAFHTILTPGDWNGDATSDLMGIDAGGRLWLLPGNGRGGFLRASQIGQGWSGMNAVVGLGSNSGWPDTSLYARDDLGRFWRYPGTGRGAFGRAVLLAKHTSWY